MKKVVFYIEPEWAFGSIHYELTKQLFQFGINSFVLPWNKGYTKEEIAELCDSVDYFVSSPHGILSLTKWHFDVPLEKCIAVCHAVLDLNHYIEIGENSNKIPKFAVVSEWLKEKSAELNIARIPEVVELGINFNSFYAPVNEELRTVGFAGSFNQRHIEIKRGWLAEKVVALSGLNFKVAERYHNSFVTMMGFYKTVDAILISSTEEGAGLPALEAGAAGKLVISTPVGLWDTKIKPNGGLDVPIDEGLFIDRTLNILEFYKKNKNDYKTKCINIQEHARSYDWKFVIHKWAKLLL